MTLEDRVDRLEKIINALMYNPWIDATIKRVVREEYNRHGTTKESKEIKD